MRSLLIKHVVMLFRHSLRRLNHFNIPLELIGKKHIYVYTLIVGILSTREGFIEKAVSSRDLIRTYFFFLVRDDHG
jgi:hypothetical protein